MKKALFILTFGILVVCSCNKFAVAPEAVVSASFNVSMDAVTKAPHDNDGKGSNVNRCILQIWKDNELFKTVVRTAPSGTAHFSFKGVVLDPEGTYDFLFWADCGTPSGGDLYYSTESLKNVTLISNATGNNEALDAFCNKMLGCHIDDEYHADLILRRPLAQLNVITMDMTDLSALPLCEEFIPKTVSYSYMTCMSFDVREGRTVGEPVEISVKDAPVYDATLLQGGDDHGECTLVMTYLFPPEGESVSAIDMTIKNANGTVINSIYDNIPFKTNYRTNICGNLITAKGDISVLLSPLFDGEYNL